MEVLKVVVTIQNVGLRKMFLEHAYSLGALKIQGIVAIYVSRFHLFY
jgi:hypothetical protein